MAISLESIKPTTASLPPRLLVYGPPGIGKTSFATEFPDPIVVRVEDGIPSNVNVLAFPVAETFDDVISALRVLYEEDTGVGTVIVDSVTELQKLVFAETCRRGDEHGRAKAHIEDFGYGSGYKKAQNVLGEFVEAINLLRRDRGVMVVLIAHSVVGRFEDPESESYDQFQIDLHKALVGQLEREMDAILLIKAPVQLEKEDLGFKKTRAIGTGGRIRKIYTEMAPAYVAKNRYGMPPELRYDKGKGFAAIAPYLPGYEPPPTQAPVASEKEAA